MYVEVPTFLLFLSFSLSVAVTTNLLMYRTCYITLGYNQTECALLGTSAEYPNKVTLEQQVQPIVSVILMAGTIISSLISVLCSLFIGPWSDRYGRRPVILSSLIGFFISYLSIVILCLLPQVSQWWWLLSCLISSLGGGLTTLLTVSFCYITDTTSEENRSFRMGVYQFFLSLGILIGNSSCSYVFKEIGYTGIFATCVVLNIMAIIYTYFYIKESVREVETQDTLKNLFDIKLVLKIFKTCAKPRENKNRSILFIVISILFIYMFVLLGESPIFYLFVRDKFDWSLKKFTLYSTISSLHSTVGTLFGVYFMSKFLKMNDLVLLMLSGISMCSSYFILGVAQNDWDIYIGTACKFLGGIIGPLGRSEISKIIPSNELGEIFSLTTSLESTSQVIGAPLYTYFYNETLLTNPNAYNFLSLGFFMLTVMLDGIALLLQRLYPPNAHSLLSNVSST